MDPSGLLMCITSSSIRSSPFHVHSGSELLFERASDQTSRSKQEENRPEPGRRSDSDLQARLPINAVPFRILLDPTFNLLDGFLRISFVSRQEERLRKPRQVLMPVQLMDDLRICSSAINETIVRAILAPPSKARNRVAMPIDIGLECNIVVTKNIQPMLD